jgi:hypothetical protein
MTAHAPLGAVVVVPVVSPGSAAELARLAARIAVVDGGRVVAVSVVPDRWGASAEAREVVEVAAAAARAEGVEAEGVVREGEEVADAVLACMAELHATLAVMGWQGASTTRNVFGELIDSIVGRSTIPLAVVRAHAVPIRRIVLPISEDHLLPGGARGIRLAAELARRLQPAGAEPVTVLRTGAEVGLLPAEVRALGDRVHHDRRRVDQAVGAAAGAGDLIVAPVAPTGSGLRTATTHMAWAAPEAWLLVAIDVGPAPPPDEEIAAAVADAGLMPAPELTDETDEEQVVQTSARLPEGTGVQGLVAALRLVGIVGRLEDLGRDEEGRRCWQVAVTVTAPSANIAVGAVLAAVHGAPDLEGAEIAYDVVTTTPPEPA